MGIEWAVVAPAFTAAFLASLVEVVEAFTIVLAVGTVQGWRPALTGSAIALVSLAIIVAVLGPLLTLVPIDALRLAIGVLLLLFGLRWLRKAILRAAGRMAERDEAKAYTKQTAELQSAAAQKQASLDWIAGLASFKAVLLEGIEVVFIVIAVGATRSLVIPASIGALAAVVVVAVVGAAVHKPLSRVPENLLKYIVGVMLTAYGLFWAGEGMGIDWPGADLALLGLAALTVMVALGLTAISRPRAVTP